MGRPKFSIVKKMVLGIAAVSVVTYGTSAFFIFKLQGMFEDFIPGWLFTLMTLALGVVWTGLLGWIAARWLVKPLLHLTNAANKASSGDLQVQVMPTSSDDEIRALGLSFAKMIEGLREIINEISVNYKVTDLQVSELRTAIEQAASHIERITATVEDISQGAERQSRSSEAMYASVEQVTRLTQNINNMAHSAQEMSGEMTDTIEENTKAIQSLVEGMQRLAALNQESIHAVQSLEDNANQIGDISAVVGELANQTHLLALNASIEAARAGEQGRGFAVVAGEVKKLAEQSSQAVDNINRLINQIQSEVSNAVNKISEQYVVASEESAHGEAASSALHRIIGEADKVAKTVDHIASMVTDQAHEVETAFHEAQDVALIASKIYTGTKGVFDSIQEQTAVMQEIAASSVTLRDQSAKLNKQIEYFKL